MTSKSAFRFRILDGVVVFDRTGTLVSLRPKESQVLVCVLLELLQADSVPREVVHEVVWPNKPRGRLLDNQLYQLRQKLGDDLPIVGKSEPLILDVDRAAVDVWAFRDACERAEARELSWSVPLEIWPRGRGCEAVVAHPAASSLNWSLRTALERRLGELRLNNAPAEEMILILNRLCAAWPENVNHWLELTRQTARSQGSNLAQSVLGRAKAAMSDLGLETEGLSHDGNVIIAKVAAGQRRQRVERPATAELEPTVRGELQRQAEVDELAARVARSIVAVVDGAPGNGKSWLALRVAATSGLPFVRWVFRAGIADASRELQTFLAQHFESRGADALANLLVQERRRGAPYDERWKATVVAQLLADDPTFIVLDDFHAVDPRSRASEFVSALVELVQQMATVSRILVVTREAPAHVALADGPDTVFGIAKSEANVLLANLGAEVTDRQLDQLYAWTAGNLKLLRMFAGWVVDQQAGSADVDRLLDRPFRWPGARQYLLSNFLSDLTPDEYKLVVTLALLRTAVPQAAVWDAAVSTGLTAFATVDRLSRRHIIETMPGSGGGDVFLHGLVRDFLRDASAGRDLSERHHAAAVAQRAAGAVAEELYHLAAAGQLDVAQTRLIESAERAVQEGHGADLLALLESWPVHPDVGRSDIALVRGDLLRMAGRFADAETAYRRLSARASQPEIRTVAAIGQATSLKSMGAWRRALRVIEDASEVVSSIEGDWGVLRGVCQIVSASLHAQVGDAVSARSALLAGMDVLRSSSDGRVTSLHGASRLVRPDVAVGAALCDLGWLELMAGQFAEAERWLNEASEIQQRTGDRWGQCESLGWLGRCHWQSARWEDAIAVQRESLELAGALGNVRQEALAQRHLGLLAWNQGSDDEAIAATSTALELYERMGDRYGEAACLENLGAIYFDEGEFTRAKSLFDNAEEVCDEISSTDFLAYAKLYQAKILIRTGSPDLGLENARVAARLLRARKYSYFYVGMAMRAQGEALLLLDQPGRSASVLKRTRGQFADMPSAYQANKCNLWLAQALRASGRVAHALTLMSEARERFERIGAKRDEAQARRLLDEWG